MYSAASGFPIHARGYTKRWNEKSHCGGSFLVDNHVLSVNIKLQYLNSSVWVECGFKFGGTNGNNVYNTAQNQNGCPVSGRTYRAVSTHGGYIDSTHFSTDHFPLISPSVVVH